MYSGGRLLSRLLKGNMLLCVLMLVCLGGSVHSSEASDHHFETREVTGGLEIVAYTGPGGDLDIPATLDGKTIVRLGNSAFYQKGLTSVHIPEGVLEIGEIAFERNQLREIKIPDSVQRIEEYAFADNLLENVQLGTDLSELGRAVFSYNPIARVNVEDANETFYAIGEKGVYTVHKDHGDGEDGDDAAEEVKTLIIGTASGHIASGTNVIGGHAFTGRGATDITIPESVTVIMARAFLENALTKVEIPDNVSSIDTYAFADNLLTELVIGNGLQTIGNSAFANNQLTDLVIPDNVLTLGNLSFENNRLESVSLGKNVQFFNPHSGSSLRSNPLAEIVVEDENTYYEHVEGKGLYAQEGDQRILVVGTISGEIEAGTTEIGAQAFYGRELLEISLPTGLERVGMYSFFHNQLSQIDFPDSVKTMGDFAFGNNLIESVRFGARLDIIGNGAFLPNPIQKIEVSGSNSKYKDIAETGLYLKNENKLVLGTISGHIEPGTETVGQYAFGGRGLDSLFIPDTVKTIESLAFFSNNLGNILILDHVTMIGANAFLNNDQLLLIGEQSSAAEAYAEDYNTPFQLLGELPIELTIEATYGSAEKAYVDGTWVNEDVHVLIAVRDSLDDLIEELGQLAWTLTLNEVEIDEVSGQTHALVLDEGTHTLEVTAQRLGHTQTVERTIKIDQTNPTSPLVQLDPEGWTHADQVLVTITDGEDDVHGSGVDGSEYRIGSTGAWQRYDAPLTISSVGETTIYARTLDQAGNVSAVAEATVQIVRPMPVITLIGEQSLLWEVGTPYEEPGAKAEDHVDGELSDQIQINGEVDATKPGIYQLVYTVTNQVGQSASTTRTVEVVDTTPPTDLSLSAETIATTSVTLAFAADDFSGIEEYVLFRDEIEIARLGGDQSTFTDRYLEPGQAYEYQLVAFDPSGNESQAVHLTLTTELPSVMELHLADNPVRVYAGTLVKIVNSRAKLLLPEDLPAGTTLQVVIAEGLATPRLVSVGDMYTFKFIFPEGHEAYTGQFVLTLGIDDHAEQAAIYYYNTQTSEWEWIGGEVQDDLLTVTVDHFSTYGVLAELTGQETEGEGGDGTEEQDEQLPQTATHHYNWILFGGLLLLVAMGVWGITYIRNNKMKLS